MVRCKSILKRLILKKNKQKTNNRRPHKLIEFSSMLEVKSMYKPLINPVTPCKPVTLTKKENSDKCHLSGLQCLLRQKQYSKKQIHVSVGNHKLQPLNIYDGSSIVCFLNPSVPKG